MARFLISTIFVLFPGLLSAEPYNTFDGPGFPACNDVARVDNPSTIDQTIAIVKNAFNTNTPVRASGKGHMWYDTMCSDDPRTVVIRTEALSRITEFSLPSGASEGSVVFEAGVTFMQLADYLHNRGASIGYTLVNWNITIAGSIAMGAHRSSLKNDSMVAAGALELHIVDGKGDLKVIKKGDTEEWSAASTSLGLLGVIVKVKMKIYPEFKVLADQEILAEDKVLKGDIYGMIAPHATANLWWWPHLKVFHRRWYDPIPANSQSQEGFQSTFSITESDANSGNNLLEAGKTSELSRTFAESLFFGLWSLPNFRTKGSGLPILFFPVYGWSHDVLIGGLYNDTLFEKFKTQWDFGMRGLTLELAFPMTRANEVLQRVRKAFDDEKAIYNITMTSTYRSGINIKFGRPYFDFLGQVTNGTEGGADWSKGAIMFDFPTFRPADGIRFNEPFYKRLAEALVTEFPCRPHWSKNTREVFSLTVAKNRFNPDYLARFKTVRQAFDPKGIFKSVVGETLGLYST
ncbi:hypothetical protein BKA66DRAFT_301020 [Pyrenochaeta sp. MPI-SDFR-AT-0127]|nr:hypothetical protein BKA66DRAFT_301020 [Pyrenochaeta sp. MPI-SDFR-AT-0127]